MRSGGQAFWWARLCVPALAAVALLLVEPGRAALAEPGVPVPPGELLDDRNSGELSAADRDLVVKVRLAGLWEIPAGDMAQEKSDDPRIREIGRTISAQHEKLDEFARAAAKKLRIKLPNKPNEDQRGWLAEMRDAADGEEFDQIYIDRLRAAHGNIFPAIATIRTSTRNDAVRKLAQQANQFVMTHLTLLESSGLVDYTGLPAAPDPSAAAKAPAAELNPVAQTQQSSLSMPLVVGVLAGVLVIGFLLIRRDLKSRRQSYRSRGSYRYDY
jgi:predicted outer membrane protein